MGGWRVEARGAAARLAPPVPTTSLAPTPAPAPAPAYAASCAHPCPRPPFAQSKLVLWELRNYLRHLRHDCLQSDGPRDFGLLGVHGSNSDAAAVSRGRGRGRRSCCRCGCRCCRGPRPGSRPGRPYCLARRSQEPTPRNRRPRGGAPQCAPPHAAPVPPPRLLTRGPPPARGAPRLLLTSIPIPRSLAFTLPLGPKTRLIDLIRLIG
jgi:hypothetical protein